MNDSYTYVQPCILNVTKIITGDLCKLQKEFCNTKLKSMKQKLINAHYLYEGQNSEIKLQKNLLTKSNFCFVLLIILNELISRNFFTM